MRVMGVLLAIAVALSAAATFAADVANEVYIYKGGSLNQEGLGASSWGSGRAMETKEHPLTGSYSVKIITNGLYSGGRIDFPQPVTLFAGAPEKDRYVVLSFWFNDLTRVDPSAGTNNEIDAEAYSIPKANKVRFIFRDDKGTSTAVEEPTNALDRDDNWVRIAVPLTKLRVSEGAQGYKLSRLLVFTDIPTTFYLGEIKLATDTMPIKAEINGTQMFGINTKEFFLGVAGGGLSTLKYSWDFDAQDGLQSEATGMVVNHVFTTAGDFKITLTVSDVNGIKPPAVVTYDITANG